MIKLLLKHYIYEMCIDVMFDHIEYNFLHPEEPRPRGIYYAMRYLYSSDFKQEYPDTFPEVGFDLSV